MLLLKSEKVSRASLYTTEAAALPAFQQETRPISVALITEIPSPLGSQICTPQPLDGWSFTAGLGNGFLPPVAGVFTLTYGANTTAAIPFNANAATIGIAINALASVQAAGGVTITDNNGLLLFQFGNPGARTALSGDGENLAPLSVLDFGRLIQGTSTIHEVQTLRIVQNPGAYADLTTPSQPAAATVTVNRIGGSGFNHKITVSFASLVYGDVYQYPYAGQWALSIGGVETATLDYNEAGAAEVQAAIEALPAVGTGNVSVAQLPDGSFLAVFQGDKAGTDMGDISADANLLSVIPYLSGTLDCRTPGIDLLLGGKTETTCFFEVEGTPPGGALEKLFREEVTLQDTILHPADQTPQPFDQYYTAAQSDARFDTPNARQIAIQNAITNLPAPPEPNLYTGNAIWVDAVEGDDSTAIAYSLSAPYLTLTAAKNVAVAGDTIVVRPGAYTVPGAPLLTDGVNWHFETGARVTVDVSASANAGIFTDSESTPVVCRVTGYGDFTASSTDGSGLNSGLVDAFNSGSDILVIGNSFVVDATCSGTDQGVISSHAGRVIVRAETAILDQTPEGAAVWWFNGQLEVSAPSIRGKYWTLVTQVNAAPTGELIINGHTVDGGSDGTIYNAGTNTAAAVWLNASIVGNGPLSLADGASSYGIAYSNLSAANTATGNNKFYLNAQKIFGTIRMNVQVWVTASKIAPSPRVDDYSYSDGLPLVSGGTVVAIQHYDLSTNTVDFTGASAIIDMGYGRYIGGTLTCPAGTTYGITGGGYAENLRINTSAMAGKSPVYAAGDMVLHGCILIANAAADSIASSAAVTIKNYRSYANRAKNSNVTVQVDTLIVDANVA